MQFVALSDSNASDFVGRLSAPILKDASAQRVAWKALDPAAVKHDTVVFNAQGQVVLYRRASAGLGTWRADIAAAVRSLPP
ncbi:MAG: hypothetical protein Q8N23_18730 [Archangium sp.]|nr:hypothetical protein [Archangium sp.]